MRALITNTTFLGVLAFLIQSRRSPADLAQNLRDRRWTAFFLLGALVNVAFAVLAGYINPRDYVQDAVAAHQFLRHQTLYPADLPSLGVTELAAPVAGRALLETIPVIHREFDSLTEPPAPANAHPPIVGMILAAPVGFFGLRGSFLLVDLISGLLLLFSLDAIVRELFGPRSPLEVATLAGLLFGWYQVDVALRGGQPSIVILFLLTMAWLSLRRGHPWLAGTATGIAACLHAFPALLILYFAVRSWRACVSAVGTMVLLGGASLLFTVPATLNQWVATVRTLSSVFVPRVGNVSLAGLVTTLSGGMHWGWDQRIVSPTMLLLVGAVLAFFLLPWRWRARDVARIDIEFSIFATSMLLASPISWPRYFPILVLPATVLAKYLPNSPRSLQALLAVFVLLAIPSPALDTLFQMLVNLSFPVAWLVVSLPSFTLIGIAFWLRTMQRQLEAA